jgi:hypothetical protein
MEQEVMWPIAAMPKRSSDGARLDQILAPIHLPDFTSDAKEDVLCSLPEVVRQANHPCHNAGYFRMEPLGLTALISVESLATPRRSLFPFAKTEKGTGGTRWSNRDFLHRRGNT